ncbi:MULTISPECIES: thiamine-phosphate kinase [Gammaproteobacteria]|uniref:thiamine-phosphate kinase n=1 Tax=Gammaproteobacteria TaxID=1236 RepID=UPI000DD061D0|nr:MULTISPECIES: thiamine-phosphate kinase [Gammaproteobacteria]RTE85558.1 thiamine-phosphate kinase [Aliidiomarina sp. B3213]TCZ89528.1 thiamine-phosphate kinase [Lysobacter sp. N42]
MDSSKKEFDLISRYFQRSDNLRWDVKTGIGDDAAVVSPGEASDVLITTDTMVAGVHFDESLSARAIGHKLVAVNLSDLASMGAEPAWLSLALTLPSVDEAWLEGFSQGFMDIAQYYNCDLIGGDVTRGPLTLTVTAHGLVPSGKSIHRSDAQPGDRIYVSGNLGDARAALEIAQSNLESTKAHAEYFTEKLHFPTPQVALGQALRGVATSAIDLSDGLIPDLRHMLAASEVGARIHLENLSASEALQATIPDLQQRLALQCFAGDDYQLCFTVPESRRGSLETVCKQLGVQVSCIGVIDGEDGLYCYLDEEEIELPDNGFVHFGANS